MTDLSLDFEVRLTITVSWRINRGFKSRGNNFVFITLALKEGQRSGAQTLQKSISNNRQGKNKFLSNDDINTQQQTGYSTQIDLEGTQTKWTLGRQRWEKPFSPLSLPHAFSNGSQPACLFRSLFLVWALPFQEKALHVLPVSFSFPLCKSLTSRLIFIKHFVHSKIL